MPFVEGLRAVIGGLKQLGALLAYHLFCVGVYEHRLGVVPVSLASHGLLAYHLAKALARLFIAGGAIAVQTLGTNPYERAISDLQLFCLLSILLCGWAPLGKH